MNSDKIASIMDDLSAELPTTLFAVKALVTAPGGTLGHLELRVVTVPFVELPHLLEKGRTAFRSNGCIEVWLAWQRLPEGTNMPDAETTERLARIAAERLKLLAVAAGTAFKLCVDDESTEMVVARRYSVCVYRDPLDVRSSWDRKERVCRNLLGRCDDSDLGVDELAHVWLERPEDLDGSVVESLVDVADRNVNCRAEHIRLMLWANSMLAQFGERPRYNVPITTRAERVSMRVPDEGAAYLQWDSVEVPVDDLGCPSAVFDQLVPLRGDVVEAVHVYLRSADDLDYEMIHRMLAQARTSCAGIGGIWIAKLEELAKKLIERTASDDDSAHHNVVAADRYVVVSADGGMRVEGRWVRTDRVATDLLGDVCSRGIDDNADILASVWLKNRDKLTVETLDKLAQMAYANALDGAPEDAVWRWADETLVAMGEDPHYVADLLDDAGGDKAPEDDGRVDAERFVVRTVHEDGSVRVEGILDKKAQIRREDVGEVLESDEILGAEDPQYDVDDDLDTLDRNDVLAHVWLFSGDDLDEDMLDDLVSVATDADACGDAEYEALMRWADEKLVAMGEDPHYVADSYDEDDDEDGDDDDEGDREEPRVVDVTLPPPQPHVVDVMLPPPPKPQPQPNYIRW